MNVVSKKQEAFLTAPPSRLNLLTGSVSSGKTWISLLGFALFVASCPPDYEFIMCGKTITSLKRNCLNLLQDQVGAAFTYSIASKSALLFGRKVWIEGANDERSEGKIRGMTLGGAYCDELTLFPEGFYMMLLSRLRKPGAKLYATTNPDAPTHWVKQRVLDNIKVKDQLRHWHFTLDDNDHNDPQFVEDIKASYSASPVMWSRYILGEWQRAEGVIYKAFADNPDAFMLAVDPKTGEEIVPRFLEINIGIDPGGTKSHHSFVATGYTKDYTQLIGLMSERHEAKDTTSNDLDHMSVNFARRVIETYGFISWVEYDNEAAVLGRGIRGAIEREFPIGTVRPCEKPRIKDRIDLECRLMGLGRFKISRHCETLKKALCEAVWDEKNEDERLDDGTSDIDTLDAFEYSFARNIKWFL